MIKVVTSITHPSTTVPGRSMSSYMSTPVDEPTQSKILKILQDHFEVVQYHLKNCDPAKVKINISIG